MSARWDSTWLVNCSTFASSRCSSVFNSAPDGSWQAAGMETANAASKTAAIVRIEPLPEISGSQT
jgi:hypothetical protein